MKRRVDYRPTAPSIVSLVVEALTKADDFLTVGQIQAQVGTPARQPIYAALSHLRQHKAADLMVSEGTSYWYLTPDTDDRLKTVDRRIVEEPGSRKMRNSRKTNVTPAERAAAKGWEKS